MTELENSDMSDEDKEARIQELREIISNAQETMSSATQLLATLQGVTPEDMPINRVSDTNEDDGQAIYGFFDGQIMVGDDGKQYPVPANYASKSKLVEGDKLKLTITPDNRFVYKQIGPVQRNYLIGIVKEDERGNYTVQTPEKEYKVLLAAATYFKIAPNDEVTLIVPQGKVTVWGAIENVLQKNTAPASSTMAPAAVPEQAPVVNQPITSDKISNDNGLPPENSLSDGLEAIEDINLKPLPSPEHELTAIEKLEKEMEEERKKQENAQSTDNDKTVIDEWESDIEQLKQEANATIGSK